MPLPKCVKVELDDKRSRDHLESEGWRLIGALQTYRGKIYRQNDSRVDLCDGQDVIEIAEKITWHGRLWKDSTVDDGDCWEETRGFLLNTEFHSYKMGEAAFIICDAERIHLIGVHPAAAGLGLASVLIRSRFEGYVSAGTYSDNEAAKALYRSLDMGIIKQQAVFHK